MLSTAAYIALRVNANSTCLNILISVLIEIHEASWRQYFFWF